MQEDIFTLMVSDKESDFQKKVAELEMEMMVDFVEEFKDTPFVGWLIKLGKIGVGFLDFHFMQKISKFLSKSCDIPLEQKEKFLNSLTQRKRKKIYEYLVHFLYAAESVEKAELMGIVFRERLLDYIDDDLFLRLCSVIHKSHVDDLRNLGLYLEPSNELNYITDNLNSYGLLTVGLDQRVENGGYSIRTKYQLNSIGRSLCDILKAANWM